MVRFKNLVLGAPEDTPDNVVAGRAARGYVQEENQGQNNNTETNTPSTPVAKVQPVSTESNEKTETAPAPDLSAPHGGMMAGRVNAGAGVKGNTVEATTETGTGTETQQRYKPVILPHLDKTQEEKTLEGYIKQIKQMTPEEKEKALKKAKRKALFSALGDGINAMANIFGTSHGSTYIPQVSLTEGQKKRWDDRMKKLKGNEEKYYMYERERAKLADNRKLKNMDIDMLNEKSKREADMANLEYNIKEYGLQSAQTKSLLDQLELLYKPEELQAKIDEINSRVELNQAKTTTEGEKQKTERTTQGKNNALANKYTSEANLANERTKYVGKSTKGTVVITDGETEYELPNNVLENSYVQLYKDIIKDKPTLGKTAGGSEVQHTAAEKWDIVRTHWMESPTAMGTLAKMANTIDGAEIEEYE